MQNTIIFGLALVVIISLTALLSSASNKRKIFKNNVYTYGAKNSLMTKAESDFFIKLDHAVQDQYYVFPQVHLSALFDHHVNGQDWGHAFRHINGKSVDYVLCSRKTLRPTYAIELDDYTHDQVKRQQRDTEVERIFAEAGVPLVRFKNKDASEANIIQKLIEAHDLAASK